MAPHRQEDIPLTRNEGLLVVGPNSNQEKQRNLVSPSRGDRNFRPKSKCTLRCPQESISVDNVSLVTAR